VQMMSIMALPVQTLYLAPLLLPVADSGQGLLEGPTQEEAAALVAVAQMVEVVVQEIHLHKAHRKEIMAAPVMVALLTTVAAVVVEQAQLVLLGLARQVVMAALEQHHLFLARLLLTPVAAAVVLFRVEQQVLVALVVEELVV
jgi:hypothetical protein